MGNKSITIQTNTKKKGKLDQRSFTCELAEHGNQKVYVLDNSCRDLSLKRFSLTEGCRIFDNEICYPIQKIMYLPRPKRPLLIVDSRCTI